MRASNLRRIWAWAGSSSRSIGIRVEYARGLYHWEELDHLVAEAQKYGLKIMFSVARAPGFSRPEPVEEDGPPSDFSIFRDFMFALSNRYQGRVAAYELWNEPNLKREWRGFDLSAEKFVELIKAGSSGVREGDPMRPSSSAVRPRRRALMTKSMRLMIACICGRCWRRAWPTMWMRSARIRMARAIRPTSGPRTPRMSDRVLATHPSFFFLDTIEDYHAILLEAKIDLPIWITEFGWPSIDHFGKVDTTGWEYAREVTEADQAAYLLRSIALRRDRGWVGPLMIWNLNVAPLLGADRSESAYGLIRPDGSLRPAYQQLRGIGGLTRVQPVADARFRGDEFGVLGIIFDGLPQFPDVPLDAFAAAFAFGDAQSLGDGVDAEGVAGVFGQ